MQFSPLFLFLVGTRLETLLAIEKCAIVKKIVSLGMSIVFRTVYSKVKKFKQQITHFCSQGYHHGHTGQY